MTPPRSSVEWKRMMAQAGLAGVTIVEICGVMEKRYNRRLGTRFTVRQYRVTLPNGATIISESLYGGVAKALALLAEGQ